MKLTLTITASATALARVLEMLESDDDAEVVATPAPQSVHTFPTPEMPALPVFPAAASPVMPEVAAAAPTVPGEPEFDSTGLAWDARIHSKQKGQTNDGKWRKQRGVDEGFTMLSKLNFMREYNAPAAPVAVAPVMPGNVPPIMMTQPVAPVVMEQAAVAVESAYEAVQPVAIPMPVAVQPTPVAIPMPVAVPAPAPQPVEAVTFHTVMTHVGTAMSNGTMTPDYLVALVTEINQQCGLSMQSFTDMAAFPNAVEYCWAAFARDGKL